MRDLVDRQAAIEALGEAPKFKIGLLKKYAEGRNDQWFDDVAALVKLPSAQPEVTEEAVKEYCRKRNLCIVDSALLKKYASAQPETAKRIVGKSMGGMTLWYQCDMCNEPVDAQDNYCCGCGRRLIDE